MTPEVSAYLKGLPRRLKVGAYDWSVVIEDTSPDKRGEADFETQTLRLFLDGLTSPSHCVGIVIHECLHIIYDNQKMSSIKGKKDAREEAIVVALEHGMVSLFRDNSKLLTWIKKGLK